MISKTRSFRDLRNPIGVLILLAAFAAAAGCSTANTSGDGNVNHVDASGHSIPGWLTSTGGTHASTATTNYIANGGSSSCTECHGSDLAGGISSVSCFGNTAGCHHGPVPNWITAAVHGAVAKKAPGSSGFASCQICHGKNFSGGGADVSCFTCHGVSAPHAPKPWRASGGTTLTHTTTDTANAPVCALCHYPGSLNNPANHPATPAPAGTAPGCFNNTLCHAEAAAPHPVGASWVATSPAAQPHGISAKATPGAAAGYAYCQACHGTGTDFAGGSSGVSCYPCHGPTSNSPHASQWRTGDTYVHTTTAEGNAPVCAYCHRDGANSPIAAPSPPAPAGTAAGCFNGTLCHASVVPHPVGASWVATSPAAQPHGISAKATPGAAAGYAYCQACHGTGTDFAGGSSGVSCYPCHGPTSNSPHASQWRTGDIYVHTTTSEGNAPVCAYCHRDGANSPIAAPSPPAPAGTAAGCFNSTLCHASVAPHPVGASWVATSPAAQPHGNSAKAAPGAAAGFLYCQACHGTGTDFAGGTSLVSCYPCHGNVGTPHPSNWVGGGTYTHRTTNTGNATVCAFCHLNGANSPIAPPSPPAPAGTAVGCLNNTLCHN